MTQIWKYIHLNASCRKYKRTNTHARMSHVIHLNTSCRTCGWVMSRILMRHLTPQNESQRKRVTQMSNVSGWVTMLMRMSHTEPFCFCYENLCRDTFVVTDSWLIRDSFVTHSRASQCERVTTHIFTPQNKSRRMSHDDVWLILIVTHSHRDSFWDATEWVNESRIRVTHSRRDSFWDAPEWVTTVPEWVTTTCDSFASWLILGRPRMRHDGPRMSHKWVTNGSRLSRDKRVTTQMFIAKTECLQDHISQR